MNLTDFITKSNIKHINKYNYSKTIVANYKDKVIIICKNHGEFIQQASHHLRGNGCPTCAIDYRASLRRNDENDIINRFISIHGYTYDYSKSKYMGIHKSIEIICKHHGSFFQQPNDHINGTGCPRCVVLRGSSNIHKFIEQARLIHQHMYGYDQTTYINNHTKVKIECNDHGIFEVTPQNHLTRSSGCPKCANIRRSKSKTLPISEIINIANVVHHNKYVYNWDNYKNTSSKISINCPIHGEFLQKVQNHIFSKQGCPACGYIGRYSAEYFEKLDNRMIAGKLYLLRFTLDNEEFLKIGITKREVSDRWKSNKGFYIKEEFIVYTTMYKAFLTEQFMLNSYLYKNRHIPSIKIGGDKECFKLTPYSIPWLIEEMQTFHNALS